MRIAQVAPLFESVPPRTYGGTERVVSYLTEALVELGHDVTLFASGDSRTRAHLEPVAEVGLRLDPRQPDWLVWHTMLLDRVFERADAFDVIHFHIDFLHYPMARQCRPACLTTLHSRLDVPDLAPLHQHFADMSLVSISDSQRAPLPTANWLGTVYHGLPADLYEFHAEPDDYFAFIGRTSPEKGLDRAIEIARACRVPLRVAAKIDTADRGYFQTRIKPLLADPLVEYVGEIDEARKNEFLGKARALLFPINWPEPFGMVMIEAMACGTPIVAYRHGAVPEVMCDGVTGYIVDSHAEAVAAARAITGVDRRACRQVFEQRFTAQQMARGYLDIYERLARR